MIVLAPGIVVPPASSPATDYPVIGWRNVLTGSNVSATSAEIGRPVSDIVNPATHLYWQATSTAEQYLSLDNLSEPVDYVGIAGHNLGSAACLVSVEWWDGFSWAEAIPPTALAGDDPAMFLFTAREPGASLPTVAANFVAGLYAYEASTYANGHLRLRIQSGTEAARIAVMYVGRALVMERRIYAGHTPLPLGREVSVANGVSESGRFLGRVVSRETRASAAPFRLLSPAWVREHLDPFLAAAKTRPFFFAWRPSSYPREVGYAWLTNDPKPVPETPSNLMAVELQMGGIA